MADLKHTTKQELVEELEMAKTHIENFRTLAVDSMNIAEKMLDEQRDIEIRIAVWGALCLVAGLLIGVLI